MMMVNLADMRETQHRRNTVQQKSHIVIVIEFVFKCIYIYIAASVQMV